ncbi:MAG TPA: enoyl-CoA hydratase/isomerase family protein [Microthrixaceae bacterium]|nr:enoyl-CoA hydratase/isomerase family protein [Microthrixaceae bacterium]
MRIVHWADGENRFNAASIARWHEVLDELISIDGPLAVVVTGHDRFFSNGLDLDWMSANPDLAGDVVRDVHRLFGRFLVFPGYVVGALNGHAFAAGAMLASTFDSSVMRSGRGFWCLPEVDLGLPLTEPMLATVMARLPRAAAIGAAITARRYTAEEAVRLGIVSSLAPEHHVVPVAIEVAASMAAKDRTVIGTHKAMLFGDVARLCGWSPEG